MAKGGRWGALQGKETRDASLPNPTELHALESRLHRKGAWSVREGADGKGPALAPRQPPASRSAGLYPAPPGPAHHRRCAPAVGGAPAPRLPYAHPSPCPPGVSAALGDAQDAGKRAKTL